VLLTALFLVFSEANLQQRASLRIEVRSAGQPVPGATVTVGGNITHTTPDSGIVTFALAPGEFDVLVTKDGLAPGATKVVLVASQPASIIVDLVKAPEVEEEITVSATRTGKRLDDQPVRVEVLVREEIEEKMLMTPGDIVMMLNEMGGMRVQATSPSLGAASVRVQGMRGQYTRFLSDGLPLFGEQVGSIGLLQIPPMDLGQVEVIKGVASSLYGAGAMGGIVNLVSRRPGEARESEILLNRSTRGGTDAVLFHGGPINERWGATLLAGGHWQELTDVNDDHWSDLPGYARAVLRPRLFWDDGNGRTFFATGGFSYEDRNGGSIGVHPTAGDYPEALETWRVDGGASTQRIVGGKILTARTAVAHQRHVHQFGDVVERDRHTTLFGEVALRGAVGRHTWVAGAAVEHDAYNPLDVPRFEYSFTVPGAFVQDDVEVASWLSLSASARLDRHSEYGTFFSPRISALLRSGRWSSRLSTGTGFFGPSALTEETEAAGLTNAVIDGELRAEKGRSASVDVTRTHGAVSVTATFFLSRIEHPLGVDRSTGLVLRTLDRPTKNQGIELLGTFRQAPFAVTASYTFVDAEEDEGIGYRAVPLTPRHSAGLVAMWEREEVGRVGLEWYYTGQQRLEENPFRDGSESYGIFGLLAERQVGRLRLFVNGENLTGTRQTKWDPLVRPTRAADGRWTVDAWAPLEGRTINGGLRVRF
jgi:outer membrane receptor for ferrienterochelin and colicins